MRMLLEKGADVNGQGGVYVSALQAAAAEGKKEITRMLLENIEDADGHDGSASKANLVIFFISRLSVRRQLQI